MQATLFTNAFCHRMLQCCSMVNFQSWKTEIEAFFGNYRSKSYRKTKKHCFDQNLFDLGPWSKECKWKSSKDSFIVLEIVGSGFPSIMNDWAHEKAHTRTTIFTIQPLVLFIVGKFPLNCPRREEHHSNNATILIFRSTTIWNFSREAHIIRKKRNVAAICSHIVKRQHNSSGSIECPPDR